MARRAARLLAVATAVALPLSLSGLAGTAQADHPPVPGDETMHLSINDSYAGGSVDIAFELAYAETTVDGTPVYVYVPEGAFDSATTTTGVVGLDPAYDPIPDDDITPCADNAPEDFVITPEQVTALGEELVDQIVRVDVEHFGPAGDPVTGEPSVTAPIVMLVYNDFDDAYYDCAVDTYTAGYFSDLFIEQYAMNVMVIDAFDWINRTGPDAEQPFLYEGVVAHELEHLLHHYSDRGETSWVDEGLADFAIFLNGYDVGGSHLTYHQVFHRETSLTRWGGGLENYGASYTYFQYLWEQAGGNGDGTYEPDLEYDAAGGDLLIKLVFQNPLDGMAGVNAAIEEWEALTGTEFRTAEEVFRDWTIAIYLDAEGSSLYDIRAVDFGDPASTSWTIDAANDVFFRHRGQYGGAMPDARWEHSNRVPGQTALPFGTSYETFRNVGEVFSATLEGEPTTRIAPHTGETHWYAGYSSGTDNVLDVEAAGPLAGQVVDFWTWYFIEEGWDYGYLEAEVDGVWTTVPLYDDTGAEVTTDTDPHENNAEGNGLTGTSGGTYFVDEPEYVHLTSAPLPEGTTDVRFRYSTDQAYLDTGWFVDDVQVGGAEAVLTSDDWILTTGEQVNGWTLTLLSTCDLSPGTESAGESFDEASGYFVYAFDGASIDTGLLTSCRGGKGTDVVAIVSNMPSGELDSLDADYVFRLSGGPAPKGRQG